MLKKLLKNTELKDITVSRHIEPRYVTRKILFIKKTIQDGDCAIYIVKKDYIHSVLKVEVVCGDNIKAQDISVFDGVIYPEHWTALSLSDQEKIETWRAVKKLHETEQKRMQEPEFWKEKLENAKKLGRQQRICFIDTVLKMLRNIKFLQEWDTIDNHEQGHEGDVGMPRQISYVIIANGYKVSLLVRSNTLTIRKDDKNNEKLVFAFPDIEEYQQESFMSIYDELCRLESQQRELAYEKEQAIRTANQRKAEYERRTALNQMQQTKYDAFLKGIQNTN